MKWRKDFTLMPALRTRRPNRWRGLVLGAVGGAVGTLVMGLYFRLLSTLVPEQGQLFDGSGDQDGGPHALDNISLVGTHYLEGEDSTAAVGRIAYLALAGKAPQSQETRTTLGEGVHWGFGIGMGALYGALRDKAGWPDLGGGLTFGSTVWLFASEITVPLLGLAPGPTALPAQRHLKEFGAHLIYGAVVAAVTQALQRLSGRH